MCVFGWGSGRSASAFLEEGFVHLKMAIHEAVVAPALRDPLPGPLPLPLEVAFLDESDHRVRQGRGILRLEQRPHLLVYDFREPAHVGCGHRKLARHGLQRTHGGRLHEGRENGQVAGRQQARHLRVRPGPQELDGVAQVKLRRQGAEARALGAVTDEDELGGNLLPDPGMARIRYSTPFL